MALETGNRIADLVATNPEGATDFVAQGDDHIRLLKACIQGSLPNLGATAVTATGVELNHIAGVTSPLQAQIDAKTTLAAVGAAFQPLDADLTAIAALTTAAYGRDFLTLANNTALATKIAAMQIEWTAQHHYSGPNPRVQKADDAGLDMWADATPTLAGTVRIDGTSAGLPADSIGIARFAGAWRPQFSATGAAVAIGNSTEKAPVTIHGGVSLPAPASGPALQVTTAAGEYAAYFLATGTDAKLLVQTTTSGDAILLMTTVGVSAWTIKNVRSTGALTFDIGGTLALSLSGAGAVSVNDAGTMREAGFRDLPSRNEASFPASLAQSDGGKMVILAAAGTLTLGALADKTIVTLPNAIGSVTVAPGSGTLYWFNGSGALATGNRTMAIGAVATVYRSGSDWYIWGSGIS